MVETRHLARAPITEALVDFRVKQREGVDPEIFRALDLPLFPKKEDHISQTFTFPNRVLARSLEGVFFRSEDGRNIAQFRRDGFTFNRLKPYTSWQELWPQAFALWKQYESLARPLSVVRVALRYINHIQLSERFELDDVEQVLTYPSPKPVGLNARITKFSYRVTLQEVSGESKAHVSAVIDKKPQKNLAVLLLDIDAFYDDNSLQTADDLDAKLRAEFENLHRFKNDIFFATLTGNQLKEFE